MLTEVQNNPDGPVSDAILKVLLRYLPECRESMLTKNDRVHSLRKLLIKTHREQQAAQKGYKKIVVVSHSVFGKVLSSNIQSPDAG